jgi:hypothetical protein
MSLAATEAAFEGFRLVRRNPLVLVWWAAIYLLVSIGQLVSMYMHREQIASGLAVIERFDGRIPSTAEDFTLFLEGYNQMSSYAIWLTPLSMVIGVIIAAGIARAVLFPEQKAFGFLRLGMDEVRVFVVSLVIGLIAGVVLAFAFIVLSIVAALALSAPVLWIAVLLGALAAMALFVWLCVKWSLAIPITLTKKKIAIFDSFAATKGHFWPLLGMAIIAGFMGIVIWALSLIILLPLGLLSGAGMSGMDGPSQALLDQLATGNPLLLLTAAANAIGYALVVGVVYAPFAAAWRDIKAV